MRGEEGGAGCLPSRQAFHPGAALSLMSYTAVWGAAELVRSIEARWAEGGAPAATFGEFAAKCQEWWENDPLMRNADSHVAFRSELELLGARSRADQLAAYSDAVVDVMLSRAKLPLTGTRAQKAARMIHYESRMAGPTIVGKRRRSSSKSKSSNSSASANRPYKVPEFVPQIAELDDSDEFFFTVGQ